ncbi:uncharacterized protein LOC134432690 [Melospiza melodia melodia]|uniref:uncharacterized protein LOC134432690 n=1 Tax=Melospiza melodia melodia TaxID=1914991 RepID=UPI002FD04A3E
MVERAYQSLKKILDWQQVAVKVETPHIRLSRALYTLNFLNCSFDNPNPPVVQHFGSHQQLQPKARPPVLIKDPETWRTEGPFDLVTWGREYACVSTPSGPHWIPSKWVRPFVPKQGTQKGAVPQVQYISLMAPASSPTAPNPGILLLLLSTYGLLLPSSKPWVIPQPKVNVWRALAQSLGQDHICLDTSAVEDPMSSCLVGIPFAPGEFPPAFQSAFSPILARSLNILPSFDSSNAWSDGVFRLDPLASEPTELHLLGSANSSICFQFDYTLAPIKKGVEVVQQTKKEYQANQWCRAVLKISEDSYIKCIFAVPLTLK